MSCAQRVRSWARVCGTEEGEHGTDAVIVVVGLIEPQLGEDARDVGFDGPGAQAELLCYPEVGASLRHAPEHSTLPIVKHIDLAWLPVTVQQAPDNGWVYYRLTGSDPGQAVHEGGGVCDIVFQQVADARADGLQELAGIPGLSVGRQHENAGPRMNAAQLGRCLDAFVGEGGGHADVEDDDVWRARRDGRQ